MKICFFIGYYPQIVGGAEYQSKLICDTLKNENEIFYISYGHESDDVQVIDNVKVYKLSLSHLTKNRYTFYYFFMKKVFDILTVEKPNIVYQRILNSFSPYIASFAYKNNIKFILHIADEKSLKFSDFKPSTIVRKLFFKRLIKYKPVLICQTQNQAELLMKHNIETNKIIPNISPLIGSDKINVKKSNKIIWIANARPFKRLEIFLDIANRFIGTDLEFHVVGRLQYANNDALLDNIRKSNVIYHGFKDNHYVNNLLESALLLINTSLPNSEGLPNTFIQSWMLGTPVISLDSNPNYYFKNSFLGIYCDGDINLLYNGINLFLGMNENKYYEISQSCRKFAVSEFSLENNINKLKELINA